MSYPRQEERGLAGAGLIEAHLAADAVTLHDKRSKVRGIQSGVLSKDNA